jgi:hypothetical protein
MNTHDEPDRIVSDLDQPKGRWVDLFGIDPGFTGI